MAQSQSTPTPSAPCRQVRLRDVVEGDLETLFRHHSDPAAIWMAAFSRKEMTTREGFMARWVRLFADASILKQVVLIEEPSGTWRIAGFAGSFDRDGKREVTYWIDRACWGRGVATLALKALLDLDRTRPMHASAAADNAGSLRVLEKCGFVRTGSAAAFAEGRDAQVEEVFMVLT